MGKEYVVVTDQMLRILPFGPHKSWLRLHELELWLAPVSHPKGCGETGYYETMWSIKDSGREDRKIDLRGYESWSHRALAGHETVSLLTPIHEGDIVVTQNHVDVAVNNIEASRDHRHMALSALLREPRASLTE